jgi:hypothetical protein
MADVAGSTDLSGGYSKPRWEWSRSVRMKELAVMQAGEQLEIEVLRRPSAGEDKIKLFGEDRTLSDQGEMFKLEIVVASRGEQIVATEIYQFLRAGLPRLTLPVHPAHLPWLTESN